MRLLARRYLVIGLPLVVLVLVSALFIAGGPNLKSRSDSIAIGMPREEVERIIGLPEVRLNRSGGRGTLLCWVDQLWQLDVWLDPDGRVESIERKPSHSLLRRTVGRIVQLPE